MKVLVVTAFTALLLAFITGGDALGTAENLEIVYSGRLTPVAVAEGKATEKGFTVTWFLPRPTERPGEGLFVVSEDAAALPWPARFGFSPLEGGEDGPRIGYQFDNRDHIVPLPGVRVPFTEKITEAGEFIEGRLTVKLEEDKTIDGYECRIFTVSGGPTRQETIAVDRESGMIVRFESDVFFGRGDRFRLTLNLTQATPLVEESTSREKIAVLLRKLADAMESTDRESGLDLSAESLEQVALTQESLVATAKGTPFEALAQAISRSVAEQRTRGTGIEELTKKVVGQPAPPLVLNDLDGQPIDPAAIKNKVVVLHFWDYDNDQLATPYGQVGYLDHLHRQRGKLGVDVIGVAVNPRFADETQRATAGRSTKKLISFMNLTYPVVADDGTLLRAIGDPRSLGARLPLWVVIGPDGVVRTYKSGLYELKANEGLKELDATVVELAKTRKNDD